MKTFQTIEQAAANLKGMAKHTYNRVMSAMAEDITPGMLHAFSSLTDGAKAIALRSGNFANTFIRGEQKNTSAEEAAKELAEIAADCVSRKLRKIDMICAVAFLAEYISRQRKAIETPETPNPDNTPSTMDANGTTEFSELTHAGQCLDIYLHNTSEIYNRYTVPAINAVVEAVKRNGWQLPKEEAIKNLTFWTSWQDGTKKALQAAARLVKKHDHMTPTAKDIEQVTRNYAAYIVDCAKYEIEK